MAHVTQSPARNPRLAVRILRAIAKTAGMETMARAWYHRWRARDRAPLGQTQEEIFAKLDEHAGRQGAFVQHTMDIDPASHWFPKDFVAQFGGFQPSAEKRELVRPFVHDRVRADFLLLLLRDITERGVKGAMAELGVHRGRSARLLHHYCPERKLYLFDTFTGFSTKDFQSETIKLSYNQTQQFTDTNVESALREIDPIKCTNIVPVVGWFPSTVTPAIAEETFAFVHLDADLEAPTAAGLDFFWPRLASGGFLVSHDYNAWPGVRLAVERFRAQHRIAVVPMPDKSGSIVLAKP